MESEHKEIKELWEIKKEEKFRKEKNYYTKNLDMMEVKEKVVNGTLTYEEYRECVKFDFWCWGHPYLKEEEVEEILNKEDIEYSYNLRMKEPNNGGCAPWTVAYCLSLCY